MTDYDPEYIEKFYNPYPKRNGQKKGKAPAFRLWVKLKAAEKQLAINDVAKRNRNNGWGKYIVDCNRYLKDRMWEDEWEPYKEDRPDLPNTGAYLPPEPKEPEREWSGAEIVLNKALRDYLYCSIRHGGLPEVETAMAIKAALLVNEAEALREDIEAAPEEERDQVRAMANVELVELLLTRLDFDYGLRLKDYVWEMRKKQAHRVAA